MRCSSICGVGNVIRRFESLFDLNRGAFFGAFFSRAALNFACDGHEWSTRIAQRDGLAGVATDTNRWIQRQFTQERNVHGLGGFLAAAVAEDIDALAAVRALEVAH